MPSDDHALAHELATAAGRALLDLRARFADGAPAGPATTRELRDAGDRTAHELLVAALAERRPDDAVRSEEGDGSNGGDPPRTAAKRVWIVDPLDGTREFGELGRDDWAVHVALWARTEDDPDGDLVAGAVALPAQGATLSTAAVGPGSPDRGPTDRAGARIAVSRTRPPALAARLADRLDAQLVPMGSAGAKIVAVLQGKVDAYVHAGGQYEWDSAAPVAVVRAAGAHASRIDASPLRYNRQDPTVPDIVVCRSSLATPLLTALREAADGASGGDDTSTEAAGDPRP